MAETNQTEQDRSSRAHGADERRGFAGADQLRQRLRWPGLIVAGALLAGSMVACSGATKDSGSPKDSEGSSAGVIEGLKTFDGIEPSHTTEAVVYDQTPPVGGAHNPTWLNCGIYDEPVPNVNAVHSMEHGAVWITYQPNLDAKQVKTLKSLVGAKTYMVLSPYTDLPSPIVASAWALQLSVNSADDPRLEGFIKAYRQGPQTLEPGAPCTGGAGTPTG